MRSDGPQCSVGHWRNQTPQSPAGAFACTMHSTITGEQASTHTSRITFASSISGKRFGTHGLVEPVLVMGQRSFGRARAEGEDCAAHTLVSHICLHSLLPPWRESLSALRCPRSRLRQTHCARSRLPSRHGTPGTPNACRWATRLVRHPLYLASAELWTIVCLLDAASSGRTSCSLIVCCGTPGAYQRAVLSVC